MKNYEELAMAIVKQACEDYLHYSSALKSKYLVGWQREKIEKKLDEVVSFFNSEYGDMMCFGKSKEIFERLQKEERMQKT